jgi:hypothetical protein
LRAVAPNDTARPSYPTASHYASWQPPAGTPMIGSVAPPPHLPITLSEGIDRPATLSARHPSQDAASNAARVESASTRQEPGGRSAPAPAMPVAAQTSPQGQGPQGPGHTASYAPPQQGFSAPPPYAGAEHPQPVRPKSKAALWIILAVVFCGTLVVGAATTALVLLRADSPNVADAATDVSVPLDAPSVSVSVSIVANAVPSTKVSAPTQGPLQSRPGSRDAGRPATLDAGTPAPSPAPAPAPDAGSALLATGAGLCPSGKSEECTTPGTKCSFGHCECILNGVVCGGKCGPREQNCGTCGNACANEETCAISVNKVFKCVSCADLGRYTQSGRAYAQCTPAAHTCTQISDDNRNCGGCNQGCNGRCSMGKCQAN